MTDAVLFAVVALVALTGWTVVLILLSQSLLPMANALKVLHQVDSTMDDRIYGILNRVEEKRRKSKPTQEPGRQPDVEPVSPLVQVFGGEPLVPIMEQPDPESLEVVHS